MSRGVNSNIPEIGAENAAQSQLAHRAIVWRMVDIALMPITDHKNSAAIPENTKALGEMVALRICMICSKGVLRFDGRLNLAQH